METSDERAGEPDMRALIMGNPVARAFAITGDAWTQLILREAFYGVRRFSAWRDQLGAPRSVLADRLQRLTAAGMLETRPVAEGGARLEYRLTAMGLDMFGVAVMQGQWERKWARSPLQERYALRFYDRDTQDRLEPVVLGREHGEPVSVADVVWEVTAPMAPIAPPTSRRRRSQPIETDRPIIDRSTDIMGDYWSWAVLSAAYFRLRRFDEIHAALGVATNILADRLSRLVLHGVLERKPYQDAPVRYEYRLTEAGRDMYPIVLAMHGWSERWLYPDEKPPLRLKNAKTGEILSPVVCDRSTGRAIDPRRVRWEVEREAAPGSGAA